MPTAPDAISTILGVPTNIIAPAFSACIGGAIPAVWNLWLNHAKSNQDARDWFNQTYIDEGMYPVIIYLGLLREALSFRSSSFVEQLPLPEFPVQACFRLGTLLDYSTFPSELRIVAERIRFLRSLAQHDNKTETETEPDNSVEGLVKKRDVLMHLLATGELLKDEREQKVEYHDSLLSEQEAVQSRILVLRESEPSPERDHELVELSARMFKLFSEGVDALQTWQNDVKQRESEAKKNELKMEEEVKQTVLSIEGTLFFLLKELPHTRKYKKFDVSYFAHQNVVRVCAVQMEKAFSYEQSPG